MKILEKNMETKDSIRKRIRSYRRGLSPEEVKVRSLRICQKLQQWDSVSEADMIFVYSATQNEVDLNYFIHYAREHEIKLAFPRVSGDEMDFHLGGLTPGAFGILEPAASSPIIRPKESDNILMLVPGVAFSEKGYRIGFGKGYYDRYLSKYPFIHTCGIAYEAQMCENFTTEEFDIPMDQVVTEEREVIFNDKIRRIM